MTSKDYKQVLIIDRHELTDADFEDTLMHYAKLYHQEQASKTVIKQKKIIKQITYGILCIASYIGILYEAVRLSELQEVSIQLIGYTVGAIVFGMLILNQQIIDDLNKLE